MKFSEQSPPKIYANPGESIGFTPKIKLYQVGTGNLAITSPDDELASVSETPDWIWDGSSKWPGSMSDGEYVYIIVDDQDRILDDGNFSIGPSSDTLLETVKPVYRYPMALERPLNASNIKPYKFFAILKDALNRPIIPDSDPKIHLIFDNVANSSYNWGDDPGNASPQRDTQTMSQDGGTGVYSYVFNVNGNTPIDIIEVYMSFEYNGDLYEEKSNIEVLGRNEFNTSRVANAGIIRP
jgi:hypothetical protein